MSNPVYRVYGMGLNQDDLHYIGWTSSSVDAEGEQIVGELARRGTGELANWAQRAMASGSLSIFEIETAQTCEAARSAARHLGCYFRSLGLDVVTDAIDIVMPVPAQPRARPAGSSSHDPGDMT